MGAFDHDLAALDGTPDLLGANADKLALLVNVASKCGLTPQYEGLVELQRTYGDRGFTVLGFPCNQFLEQEPGTPVEIEEFCRITYDVNFPLSEKIEVNGEGRHTLFAELVEIEDSEGHSGDVRWNFEKFLVGRDGQVIERFAPTVEPLDAAVVSAIEANLTN